MKERPLSEHIAEMHRLSELLIPYSHPHVDYEEEAQILMLKCRTIRVDGTEMAINLSKSRKKKYDLWSVQIQPVNVPFLPFCLVCKIGQKFLGSTNLAYVDFIKNNKKIYCWTIKIKEGVTVQVSKKSKTEVFEGFEYRLMQGGSLNHYDT